jgi:hypothetical protein
MKKILILAAAVFTLAVVAPTKAVAQKYMGQTVVGANGAFSLVGLLMTTTFKAIDNVEGLSTNVTPGMSGTVDVGITDRFSIGGAHFIQVATAKWTSYTDTNGVIKTGDFHYRMMRQNTALRLLFHFGDNDDLDTYFGIRLGYSYWNTSSNDPEVDQFLDLDKFKGKFWPQAIFGVRYFFIPVLGVNAELALGFPYYLSVGVNFRFGGLK